MQGLFRRSPMVKLTLARGLQARLDPTGVSQCPH
ncbi:hypothetical protein GGP65_001748 [Salinibacter ruber]|uniref:Uncharacterized protein n=1 Tax=Salinibacter ruber TaxID=146919 RepID=A0AAW5P452_9BACT|nr:hypothetical protein [Salinibacter ruber]MCS4156708.1 hypothetical protein [Salinibacter ruber]MCS4222651.1 hypothetical protein [Salinibacter ruber]